MDAINKTYNYINDQYEYAWTVVDPRVDGMLLMSSAKPMLAWMAAYYAMVYFGPKLMQNRKPWNMRAFLILYNMFTALLNFYIFFQILTGIIQKRYTWICDIPDVNSTDEHEMKLVKTVHLYTISKIIEFLDTFCFIVRKKNNQLTFLHVYHHSTMLAFTWLGARWMASGMSCLPILLNSLVHVVMYTYYGLSAVGPQIHKYLWWKRYLTVLQLVQFSTGFVHICYNVATGCQFTRWILWLSFFYAISYLTLFGLFYQSTYIQEKRKELFKSEEERKSSRKTNLLQLSRKS
ncbi:hypothetical protein CHUAL_012544 [Chamberlinius hualienensis]